MRPRHAVLIAACELPERDGFAAITVEAAAELAQRSRATIYRWWPNKASVGTGNFSERPRRGFSLTRKTLEPHAINEQEASMMEQRIHRDVSTARAARVQAEDGG